MAAARTRLEPDVRREEILSAAREVFSECGYSSASMGQVAERAGVARGLVNHYFGAKRDLYLAVVVDLASELPLIVRTDLTDLPVEEMVERNLDRFLDAVERDHALWSILLGSGAAERDPEVARIVSAARDEVVERMAANHAGPAAGEELRLALRAFLGAAMAASGEWLVQGRASREQVQALLRRTLLALTAAR
ncbi:MAG: helix-turn-helix domain-containing protein [Solirubrobacterales bacterium]